jgi:hypothetical protein
LRPSFGFVLLVASYAWLVAFLVWGYQRPELERGWYILQQMQRDGFTGLTPSDSQVLERLLRQHAEFSHALLGKNPIGFVEPTDDGWMALPQSHLVIQASPSVPLRVIVDCRAPLGAYPVKVMLETEGLQREITFTTDTQQLVDVSELVAAHARWLHVTVVPGSSIATPRNHAEIRIRSEDGESPKVIPWP